MADAPAWTEDQLAALGDTRLPAAARVVLMAMSLGSPEGMEWRRDDVRALLGSNDPSSDDTIGRLLRSLEVSGWVARTPGGRDHGDTFRVLGPQECGSNAGIRVGLAAALKDRVCLGAALSPHRAATEHTLSPPSSFSPVPSVPPPDARARVSPEAEAAIERADGALNGCRGSLRDYLAVRVEPDRQHAYVQRVVTALEGADEWMWKDRSGKTLTEGRTKVLAAALNELASGDETGKHFTEPPGGYGNLRSKVRYLVASSLGVDSDTTKAAKNTPPRRRTPDVHIET